MNSLPVYSQVLLKAGYSFNAEGNVQLLADLLQSKSSYKSNKSSPNGAHSLASLTPHDRRKVLDLFRLWQFVNGLEENDMLDFCAVDIDTAFERKHPSALFVYHP